MVRRRHSENQVGWSGDASDRREMPGSSLCRDTGNHNWSSRGYPKAVCANDRIKDKAISVTGRGGPQRYETSRLPHSGEVVGLTHRPPFTLQEDFWYSFLLEAESTQGHRAAGRIRSIEKFNDLIGSRTRDLPACSIVPQPTTLPRAPANARIVP
jgi:hypothetical protein